MSSPDERRELTRQARLRLDEVDRMRTEHRIITAQSQLRLAESRLLLARALTTLRRPSTPAPPV